MTREEAIKNIKEHCYFANLIPQAKEALDVAIKALEQEPKETWSIKDVATTFERHGLMTEQEPCEEHQREFIELVVEYLDPDLCIYPEYRGKPYFSIKYRENGKEYVGFGTYKIEMLSQWIKEYFMSSIQPKVGHWIEGKYKDDDIRYNDSSYKCDKCGKVVDFKENYCPNCGAKMTESEEV